jgi:hypothetical protein
MVFACSTFSTAERNYSTLDREMAAIVWAKKQFRQFFFGRHFKIVTDCKALKWVSGVKVPNLSLLQWFRKTEGQGFKIHYCSFRIILHSKFFLLKKAYRKVTGRTGRILQYSVRRGVQCVSHQQLDSPIDGVGER